MESRNRASKFSEKVTKEKWLLLPFIGALLMILSSPLPSSQKKNKGKGSQTAVDSQGLGVIPLWTGGAQNPAWTGEPSMLGSLGQGHMGGGSSEDSEGDPVYPVSAFPDEEGSYKTQMKNRVKNPLKLIDGVGRVDVMVILKSPSEEVVGAGRSTSPSAAQEKDSGGGTGEVANSQSDESMVLSDSGSNESGNVPVIEKELSPEISGIITSAEGGGSPAIKAEISEVMEASFGLPPHKIKVLERVK